MISRIFLVLYLFTTHFEIDTLFSILKVMIIINLVLMPSIQLRILDIILPYKTVFSTSPQVITGTPFPTNR
jgi:hypothetical protein